MGSDYTSEIIQAFKQHADSRQAAKMASYMKNKFDFLGIKSPVRKEISKPLLAKDKLPQIERLPQIVNDLWNMPQRELQYFALELLQKFSKNPPKDWIDLYEQLITEKAWWDTVDGLAVWHVGDYFKKYPTQIFPYTKKWMNSGNIWLQRSCILYQLKYRENTDFDLLKSFIVPLAQSKEFFIKKAIGWALRQYSKIYPDRVLDFVEKQPLSNLSYREATRLIR